MIKKLILFLSYIVLLFNSNLWSNENNNRELKIGLLAPFSGEYKNLGNSLLFSIQLALDEIGDKNIKIIPRDSGTENKEKLIIATNEIIEAGAKVGLIATDATTIDYVREHSDLDSHLLEQAELHWSTLQSDQAASFDKEIIIDISGIKSQVTWGTSPEMVVDFDGNIPDPELAPADKKKNIKLAKQYMGIGENEKLTDLKFDKVFIGSCTNSRIEDLREAASIVEGKQVADTIIEAIVVPGSGMVKLQAEAEGLDKIFEDAGFVWRDPGCSMCLGMNPDQLKPYERCASTSNRNFEGRQGNLGRTHLMSPMMAALTAIKGTVSNPS